MKKTSYYYLAVGLQVGRRCSPSSENTAKSATTSWSLLIIGHCALFANHWPEIAQALDNVD